MGKGANIKWRQDLSEHSIDPVVFTPNQLQLESSAEIREIGANITWLGGGSKNNDFPVQILILIIFLPYSCGWEAQPTPEKLEIWF